MRILSCAAARLLPPLVWRRRVGRAARDRGGRRHRCRAALEDASVAVVAALAASAAVDTSAAAVVAVVAP